MKIRTVVAIMALACFTFSTETSNAQECASCSAGGGNTLNNNLFSQYTTQGQGSATAGMYPAPHYVPSRVGHTYYTYQPLMPHEMMHAHSKNYYNYYGGSEMFYRNKYGQHSGGSGLNKTTVVWQNGANHIAPLPGNMMPFAGLQYKWAKYKYCLSAGGGASCSRFLGGGGIGGGFGHGHLRGHFGSVGGGCASGFCGNDVYDEGGYGAEEVYGGEVYGDETYDGVCSAGGCSAKLPNETVNR